MPTSLSSRIAKHFSVTNDARRTAREMKVSLHTVREAVYAWRVVKTMGPVLKEADQIIREIDNLGPPTDPLEGEGARLREERKRCGITLREAAAMAGMPSSALSAIERGKLGEYKKQNAWAVAYDIAQRRPDFDLNYVSDGERGAK